jgi:hypothetical protein
MAGTAKRIWRLIALFALWAIVGVPAGGVVTLALLPLWRAVEARWGIESVGHSGPADWCFELVYVVWLVLGVVASRVFATAGRRTSPSGTDVA